MSGKNCKHIKIVSEFPIHIVCAAVGTEIRWIDEEHYSWSIFVFIKQHTIVACLFK